MRQPDKDTLVRYLLIAAILLLALACFWLFFGRILGQVEQIIRYVGILVSPFVVAWLVAVISRPFNQWLVRKLHFNASCAVLVTILILVLIISAMVLLVILVLAGVLTSIVQNMPAIDAVVSQISDYINEAFVHIDLDVLRVEQYIDRLQNQVAVWATQGIGVVFNIAKGTPSAVVWFIVTLVAVFYWCRDEERVVYYLCCVFPARKREQVRLNYEKTSVILGGYIRSQVLLVTIAAATCTVGMALCGVKSPVVMGVFAGILDIIPIVGPGAVLIGWFIWAIVMEDYAMAIGLAIVYVIVIVSRQILNPKLVGDRVGLHPLLALASIFIGMQVFGLIGLILGPIVVAIVVMIFRGRRSAIKETGPPEGESTEK